jgi:protein-S-isoprenylcysteine O-methyltransferase Ste14
VKLTSAAIGTAVFSIVVPAVLAGWVPHLIAPLSDVTPVWAQMGGWLLIALGALGYLWCALDFVRYGLGTPAPIAAPAELVMRGLYRYTRNPMYVSVLLVVVGQAALRWSSALLLYAAAFVLIVNLFVRAYEEPALTRKFGASYLNYRRRVPRWLGIRNLSDGS